MKKKEKGFTLVELLVVIAIIGILAGVVLVSSQSSVEKAKRSSALSTAASVLPELVTCQDDDGNFGTPNNNAIICDDGTGNPVAGHDNILWGDLTSTGWQYDAAVSGTLADGDVIFSLSKSGQVPIICEMAKNTCCDDTDGNGQC